MYDHPAKQEPETQQVEERARRRVTVRQLLAAREEGLLVELSALREVRLNASQELLDLEPDSLSRVLNAIKWLR